MNSKQHKALVIIAHGSRRSASNEEVRSLTDKIARTLNQEYAIVHTGFLELAEPLIPDVIEQCIKQGATDIKVLPYFLSSGRHVQEDVPREVKIIGSKFPQVKLQILPHIGGLPQMVELISTAVCES